MKKNEIDNPTVYIHLNIYSSVFSTTIAARNFEGLNVLFSYIKKCQSRTNRIHVLNNIKTNFDLQIITHFVCTLSI